MNYGDKVKILRNGDNGYVVGSGILSHGQVVFRVFNIQNYTFENFTFNELEMIQNLGLFSDRSFDKLIENIKKTYSKSSDTGIVEIYVNVGDEVECFTEFDLLGDQVIEGEVFSVTNIDEKYVTIESEHSKMFFPRRLFHDHFNYYEQC